MSESQSPPRPKKESKSLAALLIPATTTIVAGLVAAGVSYYVATLQLSSEENIKKQEMFHELITSLGNKDSDHYSLLALWKIYPKDHRLIVITALQDPNPDKIRLLSQIGFGDQLKPYEQDILKIYADATVEERQHLGQLFEAIGSTQHVDVLLAKLRKNPALKFSDPQIAELTDLAKSGKARADRIATYYDGVPKEELNHRLAVAHALYSAGYKSQFKNILVELGQDTSRFPKVAAFFDAKNLRGLSAAASVVEADEASSLIRLAKSHIEFIQQNQGDKFVLRGSLDVLSAFFEATSRGATDTERFVSALKTIADYELNAPSETASARFYLYQEEVIQLLLKEGRRADAEYTFVHALLCQVDGQNQERTFRRLRSAKRLYPEITEADFETILARAKTVQEAKNWKCNDTI